MFLFVWDTLDSFYLIWNSTKRIRTDGEITDLLVGAVASYVARMALAYLLLGILAGITFALVWRVWRPQSRPLDRRW